MQCLQTADVNQAVYIVISYIPAFDKSTTRVNIFKSLSEAEEFAHQQKCKHYTVFCDIYESHKIRRDNNHENF